MNKRASTLLATILLVSCFIPSLIQPAGAAPPVRGLVSATGRGFIYLDSVQYIGCFDFSVKSSHKDQRVTVTFEFRTMSSDYWDPTFVLEDINLSDTTIPLASGDPTITIRGTAIVDYQNGTTASVYFVSTATDGSSVSQPDSFSITISTDGTSPLFSWQGEVEGRIAVRFR